MIDLYYKARLLLINGSSIIQILFYAALPKINLQSPTPSSSRNSFS